MLGVRAAVCRFSVLFLSAACSLERGGTSAEPLCDACVGLDAAIDPDASLSDATTPEPFDAGLDSDASFDAAAWGWDGAAVEPYLCGLNEPAASAALDLGHAESIRTLKRTPTRVLSQDAQHRWVLWDVATRRRIAEGASRMDPSLSPASQVDLAGELFTVPVETGVELRRAADGGAFVLIPSSARIAIAPGGSYLWSADASGLSVWSGQGGSLFVRPGDYGGATIQAAADALYVANGPAGAQLLERVAIDGTATGTPAFQGTFRAFFSDGQHFVAQVGEEAVVYTREAVEVRRLRVESNTFGGHGRYLWALVNDDNPLCAYSLTAGEPEFCVQGPRRATLEPTPGGVVMRNGERTAFSSDGLDLTGARPRPIRFALSPSYTQIASDDQGRWAIGDVDGALAFGASLAEGGQLSRLGCGRALALAGTANTLVMASADGFVRVFQVEGDRLSLATTLPLASSALGLSADGTTLAVGKAPSDPQYYEGEQSLRLFALPRLDLRRYLPQRFDVESGRLFAFSFAPATSALAVLDCSASATAGSCRGEVSSAAAMPLSALSFETVLRTELPPVRAAIALSPDGSKVAVSYATTYPDRYNMQTFVYRDGQRIASVTGSLVGWASEQALVVAREREQPAVAQTYLVDLEGRELSLLGESAFDEVVPIDGANFYAIGENTIFRIADGTQAWTGPRLGAGRQRGATLGTARVAYTSEHRVVLYTWRDL